MLYRKMPKSDDQLSTLGFGCMRFPLIDNVVSQIDEEKAGEMLRFAIDNGVNYLDTAWPYHGDGMGGPGSSELFVGKILASGYRDKVKLATKLPSWLIETRALMDEILNKQLERLQTDHIDYYLVHSLNSKYWPNLKKRGLFDFLNNARADGRIRHVGFSFHDDSKELFKEIIDDYDWDFCQIQYNYLDEDYQAGKEGLEYAVANDMGIVVMEPLKGGSLVTNLSEDALQTFDDAKLKRSPAEWALRWLWNHKDVCVVLSGMSTMEQVVENIKVAGNCAADSMNEDDVATIDKVKQILKGKVQVGCTTCGYCMPCPSGVNIPQSFSYYNDYHRFDNPKSKGNAKIMYNSILSAEEKASHCVECGACEEHCPQGIQIIEKLKEVASTFE